MGPDGVWRRIRWGNVARLVTLVALGLLVAMWPRLGGDPPRLPPAGPVPVGAVERAGAGGAERAGGGEAERPGVEAKRPGVGAAKVKRPRAGVGERSRNGAAKVERPRPGAVERGRRRGVTPVEPARGVKRPTQGATRPRPAPSSKPPDPAAEEFGLP